MMAKIINVDASGRDADGNDYGLVASREAVRDGLAENRIVRLRYPDGRTVSANEVRVTAKGLVKLAELLEQPVH